MSGSPWWYSGDDEATSAGSASSEESSAPRSGTDWGALLSGAQRMVDWATEAVMAPHAEHSDPRAHPECLICRGITLLGDSGATSTPADDEREQTDPSSPAQGIQWIPIREDPGAP